MTTHAQALAQTQSRGILNLKIEGLPYAFRPAEVKNTDAAAWFATPFDDPKRAFLGIKPWLRAGADADLLPRISALLVDVINSRLSVGALRIGIADMTGSLAARCGGWRRDDHLRMAVPSDLRTSDTDAGTTTQVKPRVRRRCWRLLCSDLERLTI